MSAFPITWIRQAHQRYLKSCYRSRAGIGRPNALVSYLPSALRADPNDERFLDHQNLRESVEIARVLNELGFNVDMVDFRNPKARTKRYDLIFGLEPGFEAYCARNPDAVKVYYATGSYWKYQNQAELRRCEEIGRKRGEVRPARIVTAHRSCEIADRIVQIGSINSVDTYPAQLQEKVVLIRQSSLEPFRDGRETKLDKDRKRFLWLASNAAALRGLDLCLEHFSSRTDLNLTVIGRVEGDFKELYRRELLGTENISYKGWMKVGSADFQKLVGSCAFSLLPTASEGFPGSVLVTMRMGLIPIVSKNAAYPGFEDFAIIMDTIDARSVAEAVKTAETLTIEEIERRSMMARRFAEENFNIHCFRQDLKAALSEAIMTFAAV